MTEQLPLHIIVLAAGRGTRMKSPLPKVLQRVGGMPMLQHVLATAAELQATCCHVVVGHGADQVRDAFAKGAPLPLQWVTQNEQLGTAHAVLQAMPAVPDEAQVLVMYGDVPLVEAATLQSLLDCAGAGGALLGVTLDVPHGYGRLLRTDDGHHLAAIVEEKDATEAQRSIRQVNSGFICAPAARLRNWLDRIGNDNANGEYYLTDMVALAAQDGVPLRMVGAASAEAVEGVNDRVQLARAERIWQRRCAQRLMREGVALMDPARFDLRGSLQAGIDVEMDIDVVIEGDVVLGDGVRIGPFCHLRNCRIGNGSVIASHTVIDGAEVGENCHIGPFARLRPGTRCDDAAHIGNFVEIKNSRIGSGAKTNHLSYIGDADIGARSNVGAGTITCNYDGANKHRTHIGCDAFIGSNTALVAPVSVGDGATIAAGSVITRDAPDGALTVARARAQKSVAGWKRPMKRAPDSSKP